MSVQSLRTLTFSALTAVASALPDRNSAQTVFEPIASIWKASQPLQPYAAMAKIIGTAAWKSKQKTVIQKKIHRISLLVKILKDKAELNKALVWAKKAAELSGNFAIIDTYANLLYVTGDKANAIAQETRAIELAKAANEPLAALETALKKFKSN